jgi:hypothetical protein
MSKKPVRTPPLDTHDDKKRYLDEHLDNELQWMLRAATEWFIQEQLHLCIDGYSMQVYAMDSTFLHARTLFEFFLHKTNKKGGNYYGVAPGFLNSPLKSNIYTKDWIGPLHSHLMHAQDRSKSRQLKSRDGLKALNEMPVYFIEEVLTLWREFETKLEESSDAKRQELGRLARKKREDAIKNARYVLNSEVAQCHARLKGKILEPPSFLSDLNKH